MKFYLLVLTLLIGVLLTLHLSMNAQVGIILKDAKMGNAIFWTIGGLTAIVIGLSSWDLTALAFVREVPLWLLTAGMIGACLVFGIAWVIPQIGAGTAFVLMIAGQVIAGLVFSHFGLLGSPVDRISLVKILGVLLLVGGAGIISFSK